MSQAGGRGSTEVHPYTPPNLLVHSRQELGAGAGGQNIQVVPSKYRLRLNHLGGGGLYSGSISRKDTHSPWHIRAQRITLPHTGTLHLPQPNRHRRPHTKKAALTHRHLEELGHTQTRQCSITHAAHRHTGDTRHTGTTTTVKHMGARGTHRHGGKHTAHALGNSVRHPKGSQSTDTPAHTTRHTGTHM